MKRALARLPLTRRLSLLMAASAVAAALAGMGLQRQLVQLPLEQALRDGRVQQLGLMAAALAAAPDAARRQQLAQALGEAGAAAGRPLVLHRWRPGDRERGLPAPPSADEGRPTADDARLLAQLQVQMQAQMQTQLPAVHQLWHQTSPDRRHWLQAQVQLQGETWILATPVVRAEALAWERWLGLGLAAALAALLAAVLAEGFAQRALVRPLAAMAQQMRERRELLRPLRLRRGSAPELGLLARAFNDLVHQLQSARDDRRQLLVGLSHDLRTPLTRLRLRADYELPEPVAQRMAPDFEALARIIEQFLAFAQGAAGLSLGRPEPLAELARHAVERFHVRALVSVQLPPGLERDGDDLRYPDLALQRVLDNLIGNALAHGRAPVSVQIEVDRHECRLLVCDGGRGIPEALFARALQPFAKLHGGRGERAEHGHCGLGLAIVAQIAERLGGRVLLRPFDGRRSAVGLALPRGAAAPAAADTDLTTRAGCR